MKKDMLPIYLLCAVLILVVFYRYQVSQKSAENFIDETELSVQYIPPPPVESTHAVPSEMVNDEYVLALSKIALIDTMTFNHGEYAQRMQTLEPFFTDEAFQVLKDLHKGKELEETIKLAQTTVITTATAPPKIVSKFERDGVRRWEIEIPAHVKYDSELRKFYETKMLILNMKISDNPNHKYGVAIYRFSEGAL